MVVVTEPRGFKQGEIPVPRAFQPDLVGSSVRRHIVCGNKEIDDVKLQRFSRYLVATIMYYMTIAPVPLLVLTDAQTDLLFDWLDDGEEVEDTIESRQELHEYAQLSAVGEFLPMEVWTSVVSGLRVHRDSSKAQTPEAENAFTLKVCGPGVQEYLSRAVTLGWMG
ncbi:hypothetical protein KIPB_000656 [Kipferlia bialata]|uniref:Uncharacterized protein n=1 Tax=Kipferlia bialata TaxID=797122 RepID=A0A9K3CPJ8_9EUKA|nr:hypothetical protein KIPB_000656 [Kipferlia bialata]|eukprot:g656.t1